MPSGGRLHRALKMLQLCDHRVVGDLVAHLDAHTTQDGRIDHRVNVHRMAGLRRIDGDELLDLLLAQWRCVVTVTIDSPI